MSRQISGVPEAHAAADAQALLALVDAYPVGARVRFRGYDPTIRPRDWRRLAEQAVWGLRREDVLEVTGYGASRGFPDALLVTRAPDGATVLVHPPELQRYGATAGSGTGGASATPEPLAARSEVPSGFTGQGPWPVGHVRSSDRAVPASVQG